MKVFLGEAFALTERLSKAAQEKKLLHKVQDHDKYSNDTEDPKRTAAVDALRSFSPRRKIRRPRIDEAAHDCKKCHCSQCGGSCKVGGKPCPSCHP